MPHLLHEPFIGSTNSLQQDKCTNSQIIVTTTSLDEEINNVSIQDRVAAASRSQRIRLENGSRLAEALAGNYPYSPNSLPGRKFDIEASYGATSETITASKSSGMHNQVKYKGNAKQPYQLPFVLQDHNYGAPPPQTPPNSPPHVTLSSAQCNSKTQNYHHSSSGSLKSSVSHNLKKECQPEKPKASFLQDIHKPIKKSSYNVNAVYDGSSTVNSTLSCVNSVPSNFIASMPLYRQQFMPHPKTPLYATSNLSSLVTGQHNLAVSALDTDEESRLSDKGSSGASGEETETAPEGEGEEMLQSDDSITRCICDLTHDDGYMIQCDRCFVWQHVDCMQIDRNNIPDEYLCEACNPRKIEKLKARTLQLRRLQEIRNHFARHSSSDSEDNSPMIPKNRSHAIKLQDRKVLKRRKTKPTKESKPLKKLPNQRKKSGSESTAVSPKNNSQQTRTANNNVSQLKAPPTSPADTPRVYSSGVQSRTSNNSQQGRVANSVLTPCLPNNVKSEVKPTESTQITNHEIKETKPMKSTRRRHSANAVSESLEENEVSLEQINQWSLNYEVAVTNHYSPELRAKIQSVKVNGMCEQLLESANGANMGHRCTLGPKPESTFNYEKKTLIAAGKLKISTAIIEYQGKYMLLSQWTSPSLKVEVDYLPYVVQYNMSKEGVSLCIDARTYGNGARFARKAPEYNAELKHIIKRGSVHVYIVAATDIDEGQEIILSPDSAICLSESMKSKKSSIKPSLNILDNESENDYSSSDEASIISLRRNGSFTNKKTLRKSVSVSMPQSVSRTTRRTVSSDNLPDLQISTPTKQRRASGPKSPAKSPQKTVPKSKDEKQPLSPSSEKSALETKMTREERKIASVMKVFEKLEKQEIANKKRKETGKKKQSLDKMDLNIFEDEDSDVNIDTTRKKKRSSSCSSTGSTRKAADSSRDENDKTPDTAPPLGTNFRFPRTKKALMTEWLNETVDSPVLPNSSLTEISGVPSCYMRSPAVASRRLSGSNNSTPNQDELAGKAAKKRWLRQAIIDESEPIGVSNSPNSRPDSPNGDYTTPLKKRRLARESMSSDMSNTPPSTPHHTNSESEKIDQIGPENIKNEDMPLKNEIKEENAEEETTDHPDRLSINISDVKGIKQEIKSESSKQKKKITRNSSILKPTVKSKNKKCKSKKKAKVKRSIKGKKGVLKKRTRLSDLLRNKREKENAEKANIKCETDSDFILKESDGVNSEEASDLTCNNDTSVDSKDTTPVKRKLSISEYRKRKNLSSDVNIFGNENGNIEEKVDVSLNLEFCSQLPPVHQIAENILPNATDNCSSPSSCGLSPAKELNDTDTDKDKKVIKWNDAPTLLEQQRENISRLRKEFGLCIPFETNKKIDTFPHNEDIMLSTSCKISSDVSKYLPTFHEDDKLLHSTPNSLSKNFCDKL